MGRKKDRCGSAVLTACICRRAYMQFAWESGGGGGGGALYMY